MGIKTGHLGDINQAFRAMKAGEVAGRADVLIDLSDSCGTYDCGRFLKGGQRMPDGNERKMIALTLVGALFYVLIFRDGATGSFMNLMFVVIGFYFGNGHNRPHNES
ncbi:MAG TPA: hypothetical protein VFC56_00540 [Stellaceae bacterium]|nr:hypothetical protein [Stellaceae bacterium]